MNFSSLQEWLRINCNKTYNIATLKQIEHLNISKKNIGKIHPDIQKLPNLKSFTACYSNLESFKFSSKTITHIILIGNEITYIRLNCKNLVSINASDNPIKNIIGLKKNIEIVF